MNRRKFFSVAASVAASVVAVAAAPVAVLLRRKPRLEIGTEFYATTWVAGMNAGSAEEASRIAADGSQTLAFRRIETERGVRLGEIIRDVAYHGNEEAWVVSAFAVVVA